MVTMTNDYPKIESEGFIPLLHYTKADKHKDCGNCWNEIKDFDIQQQLREATKMIRSGVDIESVGYKNCSVKVCKWKKKRDK